MKETLLDTVSGSQFVPSGRERLFARGLAVGLRSDFASATMRLIQQIENSIRHSLECHGHNDTSTLISKDILTDMNGATANFRNKLTHALLDFEQLQGGTSIYCWRLTLRMVMSFSMGGRVREIPD